MDLVPSPDQFDLVETVERFTERELSLVHVHERLGDGAARAAMPDPGLWRRMADIGVFCLGLPEAAGGLDLPMVEEALVFRVLGRQLAPVGFLGSVLAARLAHAAGDKELRDAASGGGVQVGVALPGDATYGAEPLVVADRLGGGHVVHGPVSGPQLSTVTGDGRLIDSLDPSTQLAEVSLSEISEPIVVPQAGRAAVGAVGTLLASAMLVGMAEACRDVSVGYAKDRVQFGRPIGVHQAVKHRCADMATRCEAATSMLLFASLALRDGRPDAAFQVAAAKRVAGRAALDNARVAIQVHGGMGFTWEHDAHLFLTRAHLLDRLFGTVADQRRALLASAPAIP